MGLAALNPLSRLRGAIRGLLAPASPEVANDAVLDAIGAVASDVRGARQDIAELRKALNLVEDAPALREGGKGVLSGDPTRPRPCQIGPSLYGAGAVTDRHPPLAGKRRHP